MNYPPNGSIIATQPQQFDIRSNFGMFPGERLLYHCRSNTGLCDLGDEFYTSLTDTRYVLRKEICVCCSCCFKRPFTDRTIYLRDIGELEEKFYSKVCCRCCGVGICKFCCCCCATMKRFKIRGTFGTHFIYVEEDDFHHFESLMTEAIARHKLPTSH